MKLGTLVLGMAVLATVSATSMQTAKAAYISGAPIVVDVGGGGGNPDIGTVTSGTISYNHSWVSTINDLVETDGTVATGTSFSQFVGGQPAGFYLNNSSLTLTGDAGAIIPSGAGQSFFGTFNGPLSMTFAGLDASTLYTVEIYAGQAAGNAGAGVGSYSAGSNNVTGTLDSTNNASNLLVLANVATDANGVLLIQANPGIVGAVVISPVVVATPEPASLSLLGLGAVMLLKRRKH